MNFDEILAGLGEFGTYQKRLYFLLCLSGINCSIIMAIDVFLLGVPDHRCAIPGYSNDTYAIQNAYHQSMVSETIPNDKDLAYDQCHVYLANDTGTRECDVWVYDDSIFKSTFVSKMDLVCDKQMLPSIAKMLYFAGIFAGALIFGILSDVIGRKKTLYLSFLIMIGSSISHAWAETYATYVILRSLVGASNAGVFMTSFVMGMELVGPSKRIWAGIVVEYFYAVGSIALTGIAFALRDWKYIEMTAGFLTLPYLIYYFILPESPRWLVSQGRYKEAEVILREAARVNKVTLPPVLFHDTPAPMDQSTGRIWQLFSTKTLTMRTLVIFFNWMVVSMVFFGLGLNTGNLGGHFYVNFLLSGLMEFPAYTLCLLLLDRVGRKWLHSGCMVLGGIACVCTVFTTTYGGDGLHWLTVTLAMGGKLGASAAFAIIYVFSAELYPTVVRNAGMGGSSSSARIGGMIAPYIADINKVVSGDFGRALPLVVFGSASIAAGLLALVLPETLHKKLPETIEDGKTFGRSQKETGGNGVA